MKKTQQQSLTNSIYDYIPNLTQSVLDRKGQITNSFNNAFTSTLSKIGQIKTNLIYSIKHSDIPIIPLFQRKQIEIKNNGSFAQLLGHKYDSDNAYKFIFAYRNTFWFTYRQGIKQIESDNGWGCMIRTMQMVFAQTLKRNLKLQDTQEDQYQVIRHFSQLNQGVLSLSEICKQGNIQKRWTSSLEIIGIFKRIMSKYPEHFKFNIQIFSSGVVYKDLASQLFESYPVMLSLTNRVSLQNIPEDVQPHYFQMMNHPSWVGAIGGVKGQALYIIGSYEKKVIFLDPHYVQSNEEEMDVETYFNKTPRGLDISVLSPSLTFSYYIENREAHQKWLEWISSISAKYYPNLIFQYISQKTKAKLQQQIKKSSKNIKKQAQPPKQFIPKQSSSYSVTVIVEDNNDKQQKWNNGDSIEILSQKHKDSGQLMNSDSDEFQVLQ